MNTTSFTIWTQTKQCIIEKQFTRKHSSNIRQWFFKKLNNVLTHFWNRWEHEYLAELPEHQHRKKPATNRPTIQVNDVVLVHDDNLPRSSWKLARVVTLIKSKDDQVRGAIVRTPHSRTLERPINKVFPIEFCEGNEQQTNEARTNRSDRRKRWNAPTNCELVPARRSTTRNAAKTSMLRPGCCWTMNLKYLFELKLFTFIF